MIKIVIFLPFQSVYQEIAFAVLLLQLRSQTNVTYTPFEESVFLET